MWVSISAICVVCLDIIICVRCPCSFLVIVSFIFIFAFNNNNNNKLIIIIITNECSCTLQTFELCMLVCFLLYSLLLWSRFLVWFHCISILPFLSCLLGLEDYITVLECSITTGWALEAVLFKFFVSIDQIGFLYGCRKVTKQGEFGFVRFSIWSFLCLS